MIEDRLTHAERVRLEALSQARGMPLFTPVTAPLATVELMQQRIFEMAERIENFILAAPRPINQPMRSDDA